MRVRDLKSTKKRWKSFLCFFLVVFFLVEIITVRGVRAEESAGEQTKKEAEREELQLYAKSALLMDANNGRVLYEKNGYEVLPMASTTKIMTAILALEYGNLEDEVTVSAYAASRPKVHLGMREGEVYKLKDLLFSLMLESHNDTAVAIAEHIGGSVEGFADMMNQKARDLGCENTFFITPNGLDASAGEKVHATTAYDLAKITAYAIQNEQFVALIGTKAYSFCELENGREFFVDNKDEFLHMMDGAIGVKTGFTNDAGYCFVGAVKKEDRTLVSVVLASGWPPNRNYKWKDTKALMELGVNQYQMKQVQKQNIPDRILVEDGIEEQVSVQSKWEGYSLLAAPWDEIRVETELKESVKAPVEKNTVVGYEKAVVNGEVMYVAPIVTESFAGKYTLEYCLTRTLKIFLWGR